MHKRWQDDVKKAEKSMQDAAVNARAASLNRQSGRCVRRPCPIGRHTHQRCCLLRMCAASTTRYESVSVLCDGVRLHARVNVYV